jgi:2-amino-4-hydroxy-6-hydroxymethyldihydropteridine diphosphokinase
MNQVVVSLGSNIEPRKNIASALDCLKEYHSVLSESKIVRTKPLGYVHQPDFYNRSVLLLTKMEFKELTLWLKEVENQLGRIRIENKFGPRTIDLDIVMWNGAVVDSDIYKRKFLKKAVLELLPDLDLK